MCRDRRAVWILKRRAWLLALLAGCASAGPTPPPLSHHIDAVLGPRRNDGPSGIPLGFVGSGLWKEGLETRPGFQGRNETLFEFEVGEAGRPIVFPPMSHQWWPSHVGMEAKADGLRLIERKFITGDDRAIDLVDLTNEGADRRELTLRLRSTQAIAAGGFHPSEETVERHAAYNPGRSNRVRPRASSTWSPHSLWAPLDGRTDRPWSCWGSGREVDWYEIEFSEEREARKIVLHLVEDGAGLRAPAALRVQFESQGLLSDVDPSPRVPTAGRNEIAFSPVRTRRLRLVLTHHPGTYSGIAELEVYPGNPERVPVWERSVSLAPGEAVAFPIELAFGGEPRLGEPAEILERHLKEYNGRFEKTIPDFDCGDAWFTKLWYYRWFLASRDPSTPTQELRWLRDPRTAQAQCRGNDAGPWELFLVHPDLPFLEGMIPRMEAAAEPIPEHLDAACDRYRVARALVSAGVPRTALLEDARERILRTMGEARDIAVFFPHAFGVVPRGDRRYDAVFDRLFDLDEFWAPYPARLMPHRPESRPFANAIVVEALANAIKLYRVPQVTRRRFFDFLQRYVRSQFEGGDFSRPHVGEVLDADSGAWRASAEGAGRSAYADLLIRHVGGLTPRPDATLQFFPIVDAFPHFRFRNVPYRGAALEILWDAPDGRDAHGDGLEGFRVKRDGKELFAVDDLRHVEWTERGGLKILE